MKLNEKEIVQSVLDEFPELIRQEALVHEIVKKVSMVYGVSQYGNSK
jgi:hypothetical protein